MQSQSILLALLAATSASAGLVRLPPRAANATTGADFGKCTPTIDFEFGRAQFDRKATEGTFFPTDPVLVASTGQTDALNPDIITNFVCNQLTNVCGANDAAKQQCASAKATVQSLGTKNQSTADAFNSALGF